MLEAVVVDASPLILLGRVGHLNLLREISRYVLVPDQVIAEVDAKGAADPAAKALTSAEWMVRMPSVGIPEDIKAWRLGFGESAVIAIARDRQNTFAVLDDRQARRCASALGVPLFGTLGVVLRAKRVGAVVKARPVLEALVNAGMYLAADTLEQALRRMGEQ